MHQENTPVRPLAKTRIQEWIVLNQRCVKKGSKPFVFQRFRSGGCGLYKVTTIVPAGALAGRKTKASCALFACTIVSCRSKCILLESKVLYFQVYHIVRQIRTLFPET